MQFRSIFQKKIFYIVFSISVVLFIVLINLPSLPKKQETTVTFTPTPVRENNSQSTGVDEKPLIPTPNPTYDAKVRREPFWIRLPHWTEHYKIEYKHSANVILIHLFLPDSASNTEKNSLQVQYRNEALEWLRDNGANTENLTIQYRIYE